MKNKVKQFVKSLGGTTAYSGKTKTMFILNDPHPFDCDIEHKCIVEFGFGLPFKLKTN